MASSHPPPQSHHHAQPLPPSGHIHHPSAYSSQPHHPQPPSRHPSGGYSSGGSGPPPPAPNGAHNLSSRHLPPLSQSPPYPHRHDNTLPPLSPYSQRPYAPNFPPPLSRSSSSQHSNPPHPPHPYHQQQQQQQQHQPPPHYPPPPPSHGHNHWDPGARHEQGPPPLPAHPHSHHSQSQPPPPRNSSSTSLNKAARRQSIVSEREDTAAPEPPPSSSAAPPPREEDGGPPASDFVKKLAKMLDDPAFGHVVCWGPKGDCFVVKDMTEFTKSILPRMFKHSNFASFVRQLNKYDFHKIKNADDTYGDQSWTFHHPDFQRSNRDALENIKRKVPAQRKTGRGGAATGPALPGSPSDGALGLANADSTATMGAMQGQIDQLSRSNDDMATQLSTLERNYQNVLNEMVAYQRGMAAQDSLMQNLISYFIQLESGKTTNDGLGKVMEGYDNTGRPYPMVPGMSYSGSTASVDSNATIVSGSSPELSPIERSVLARQESLQRLEELKRSREARNASAASSTTMSSTDMPPVASTPQSAPYITSLNPAAAAQAQAAAEFEVRTSSRIFSGGQMMAAAAAAARQQEAEEQAAAASAGSTSGPPPNDARGQQWSFPPQQEMQDSLLDSSAPEAGPSNYVNNPSLGPSLMVNSTLLDSPGGPRIRFRKTAFTPSWAVPPRVLLVDDDQVSRKLFSKFLQVSGCTIDVAVDGIGAVNKMNLEKYDLVLMDIVMPKLDGVSATSLIRQFDAMTPIISMTSNSKPTDVVTYYSSGMNDILPKPFTREGLFTMLEKHLMHLKAISQLAKPMEDAASKSGMTISEEQYSSMLSNLLGMNAEAMDTFGSLAPTANIVMGDLGASKRPLDSLDDDRETKRGRFEVVE